MRALDGLRDLDWICDLLRLVVDRAVCDASVRRAQPARGRRRQPGDRSRRAGRNPDGPQTGLDHPFVGRDLCGGLCRLSWRLPYHRAVVQADGNAVLIVATVL